MNDEITAPENPATDTSDIGREAMDRLNDQNRIQMEARMLPRCKLTQEQIDEVIERYKEFTKTHGIPASQVSKECGYSKSVLSDWPEGKYKGSSEGVARAINDWMEREGRRLQSLRPKNYIKTWIAEDIRTVIYQADKRTMMGAIVVPAGAGKTMVLRAMEVEMRALYVYCQNEMTQRDLFRAIAMQIGWKNSTCTKSELRRYIIENLKGTRRMIFLDEAHQLGKQIGCVRAIHDEARVPIVMLGTHEILKYVNDRAHGCGQFSSRTIRYNALDYVNNCEGPDGEREGRDLFTVAEIQAFFAMKKIRLDRDALRLVWALACLPNYGTLRLVENTIDLVFDAQPDLAVVTRDHVLAALQSLVGSECLYLQKLANRHADLNRGPAGAIAKAG